MKIEKGKLNRNSLERRNIVVDAVKGFREIGANTVYLSSIKVFSYEVGKVEKIGSSRSMFPALSL